MKTLILTWKLLDHDILFMVFNNQSVQSDKPIGFDVNQNEIADPKTKPNFNII